MQTKDSEIPKRENAPISACGCDTDHNNGEYVTTAFQGKRIYFCTNNCKVEFKEDPLKFINSDHFVLEFKNLENVKSED